MRVAIDCRLWDEGGVGRYIRNLVYALNKHRSPIEYTLLVRPESKLQVTSYKLQTNFKLQITNAKWHSVDEQLGFWRALEKEKFDLVHFPYFSHPILYNRPFVITIHDLTILHFPTGKATTKSLPEYYLKRLAYVAALKHGIYKSQKILVPTEFVKEDILKNFKIPAEKIVVTYEGVGIELQNSNSQIHKSTNQTQNSNYKVNNRNSREEKPYFLYVGNFYPHKNVEYLLEAFAKVKDEKVKLTLCGAESFFSKRMEEVVKKLNLESRVVFKYGVGNEELLALYSSAVALVYPSKFEGFGLPIVEATALSCPLLLADIPVFHEIAPPGAEFFSLNNGSELAEKMNALLVKKQARLSEKEKENYLAKFSFAKMALETERVYEKVAR